MLLLCLALLAVPRLSSLTVSDILSHTPKSLLLAALVLLCVYCLKSVVMVIPIVVLYISAGILFPPVWGVLITYICALCEAGIGYWIGRQMGRDKVREMMEKSPRAARFLSFNKRNYHTACFLARILPIPFDLVSMFFGASGMNFGRYLAFSLLGLSPGMIPWVITGGTIQNPMSKEFLVPFGISIAIMAVVFAVFRGIEKRM